MGTVVQLDLNSILFQLEKKDNLTHGSTSVIKDCHNRGSQWAWIPRTAKVCIHPVAESTRVEGNQQMSKEQTSLITEVIRLSMLLIHSRLKVITRNHLNELISQREIYIQIMTCGYYSSDQCNCDRLQNYRGKNLQEIWDTFKFIPFKHDTTSQKNNVPSVYLYNLDKQ